MTKKEKNWNDIHLLLNEEYKNQWISQGFTYEQTFDWVRIGLQVDDAYFAVWLRDIKKKDCTWALNYGNYNQLKEEFREWRMKKLESLNVPTNEPVFFAWKKPLIIAIIAVIATIYLLK